MLGIFLDDLHLINPIDSEMPTLSWLPFILPKNVHIVCTFGIPFEKMGFTSTQREHFHPSDYIEMPLAESFVGKFQYLYSNYTPITF